MAFLIWLENTAYAQWILTGLTGWPLVLTSHAIGLAIAVGTIYVMSLRMLGLFRGIPLSAVGQLLPFAWVGIAINVISGFSLFMTQASVYVTSAPFLVKITAIALGIVNLVFMQKALTRELANWEANGISTQGRNLAIISLVLWTLAVVTGRLIAYL
jgi:hypothetical protein